MRLVDLTGLSWVTAHSGGSYGCLYKTSVVENGKKYYYKCSNYYQGQEYFGDESINEVICSRYLSKLGFNCVKYMLVNARIKVNGKVLNTYVCKSENFYKGYDSRITFEDLHSMSGCSAYELIARLGITDQIERMLLADFLVLQRDRHGGNIELLEKNGKYTLAPLFDNGLGLLAPYPSASGVDVSGFDVLADYPVNNYIGARSLYQNLSNIRRPVSMNKLLRDDKNMIFYGLHKALPRSYIDKIWELLTYRYMFLRQRGYIVDD